MIEQSPAIRTLGAELGQAIRRDHARRQRRHRALVAILTLTILVSSAVLLRPDTGSPSQPAAGRAVTAQVPRAAMQERIREAPPPRSAAHVFLPAEFWQHRPADLVN